MPKPDLRIAPPPPPRLPRRWRNALLDALLVAGSIGSVLIYAAIGMLVFGAIATVTGCAVPVVKAFAGVGALLGACLYIFKEE